MKDHRVHPKLLQTQGFPLYWPYGNRGVENLCFLGI
jgi:hypothetical protein